MSFQVTARTILQLGAELISSDQIAFYELIKNAVDAESPSVEIEIVTRLTYEYCIEMRAALRDKTGEGRSASSESLNEIKDRILENLDSSAPFAQEYRLQLQGVRSREKLIDVLEEANYIDITDSGEGMSLGDLRDVYLTIGTRSRLKQRELRRNGGHPLLGEKGIGRLSTMRLGNRLHVKTSRRGEPNWNELCVDWSRFSNDSDELLEDVAVAPTLGPDKKAKLESGTVIHISNLTSAWDDVKVQRMVENEFSRFTDPFNPKAKYPIEIYYNNELFPIPDFDRSIFKHAHATVEAEFTVEDGETVNDTTARLWGKVNYRLRDIKKSFDLRDTHVVSSARVKTLQTLRSLGPFRMKAYWYNRQLLTAAAGVPNFQHIRNVVNQWAGGLMVYRDGFRVYPYGGPDDDWLDLDQKALSSGGYKINRRQIIGKVDISSQENPRLTDQTNREGLRESDEKRALVMLLKHVLETEMRGFLNNVEKKIHENKQLDLSALAKRVDDEVKLALRSVRDIVHKLPQDERDSVALRNIGDAFKRIQESMKEAKEIAQSYKQGHSELVHLAGIGLMVEMLAHELNRAALHALGTLAESQNEDLPDAVKTRFKALESQMKTLQKRLQVLDPLATTGRQRKETFDMVTWVKEILSGHEEQFRRHKIRVGIDVLPDSSSSLRVKAVKGMIVQVMENLISNSVYWLKQQKRIDERFSPKINVVIDTEAQAITFTDNGPGVEPERGEEIFFPFITTKPSGEGKGLGLYVAREIATYHDAKLYLSEVPTIHSRKLNAFVFSLENRK